jgi:hypothetical protein
MLIIIFSVIVFIEVFLPVELFSQDSAAELDSIRIKFESFDYKSVISLSDKLLISPDGISSADRIEVLRMRAIAQYSLWDENSARESFMEILKINNQYELDSLKNSPKIVSLFKAVRKSFNLESTAQKKEETKVNVDSLINLERKKIETDTKNFKTAFAKSLLLPGWGHLYNGNEFKGWLLISAAVITLGSSIYFYVDTYKKERDYLSATVQPMIDELYNKYNSSYKLRNISIISFAVVWIYSQLDLSFLSSSNFQITLGRSERFLNTPPVEYSNLFQLKVPL